MIFSTTLELMPGGILKLNFKSVFVRKTLPAFCTEGIPSAPIIPKAGLQLTSSKLSSTDSDSEINVSTTGSVSHIELPITSARATACSRIVFDIVVCISGIRISPVAESSILSRRILCILKEDGIVPPDIPECTPS